MILVGLIKSVGGIRSLGGNTFTQRTLLEILKVWVIVFALGKLSVTK